MVKLVKMVGNIEKMKTVKKRRKYNGGIGNRLLIKEDDGYINPPIIIIRADAMRRTYNGGMSCIFTVVLYDTLYS